MKYLIIGAASELAKYFVEQLRSDGHAVTGVSVEPGDINWGYNIDFLSGIITESKPDILINFVGCKSANFNESYEGNVLVTRNLFEAVLKVKFTGRIILIGSASEYGDQSEYSESSIEKPAGIYGLTKLMQRNLFDYYYRLYNINCCYIRPFNVLYEKIYDKNLFIGSFNRQMREILHSNGTKLLLGNLDSYRDYILIDDLHSAIQKIIQSGQAGEIYNIGLGEAIHMKKFVDDILTLTGKNIEIGYANHIPVGNIQSTVIANTSKIRQLGWSPKYNSKEIPAEYFKRLIKNT